MQILSSSGVYAGMLIIDIKGPVQVVDFVCQQGCIFIHCRRFIFPIVKTFKFHFDKVGSLDGSPFSVGQRQATLVARVSYILFNNFRIDVNFNLSIKS